MRRPHRNIEIFSMSVLDMFASALGAFIIIAVILFPYYNQARKLRELDAEGDRVATAAKQEADAVVIAQQASRVQQEEIRKGRVAAAAAPQCHRETRACETAIEKTFLVVAIEWEAPYDIDLSITDPAGNAFDWQKTNRTGQDFPGTSAELSLDMTFGPGVEIWQASPAGQGIYRISYRALGLGDDEAVAVKGWIIDRSGGRRPLAERRVSSGAPVEMFRVRLDDRGFASIESPGL
jgi:hypothetical protein